MNADIYSKVDETLCSIYWAQKMHAQNGAECKLVFPLSNPDSTNSALRVSEQEARFVFAHHLNDARIAYSVESPTTKTYSISGKTDVHARVDLVVATREPLLVEFKAKNPKQECYSKDMMKMLREPHNGIWFHLLENADSGTLQSVFAKLSKGILTYLDSQDVHVPKTLDFHFLILKLRCSLRKRLQLVDTRTASEEVKRFFQPGYLSVRKGALRVEGNGNGWLVTERSGSQEPQSASAR